VDPDRTAQVREQRQRGFGILSHDHPPHSDLPACAQAVLARIVSR
jgi:hypothetical protein